ncbi:MAG: hypothetical protein KDB27_09885 [Planctomycetales bacterium]|nr:hypothetical protein [Planctomycetales bacterium]
MSAELQELPRVGEAEFQYRSVSLLGILGLILGLASPLALISPIGWVVPAAGAIVSLVAAIRIHRNSDRLAGKTLALIGLALSLWLGTWAPTKFFVDRQFLSSRSNEISTEWLRRVVNSELESAHQSTLEFRFRQPKNTDLKAYYETAEIDRNDLQEYFGQGLIKEVVARPPSTKITRERIRTIERDKKGRHLIVNIYNIDPPDSERITIAIEATRILYKDKFYWQITGAADPVVLYGEE